MPRLVERSITATLPQAHATVKLKIVGSGQIQDDMKKDGRHSFEDMMNGVKSDVTSFVHGSFRQQIIEFLAKQECEAHESAIEYGTTLSDEDVHMSVYVQLTFAKDLPVLIKREAVMVLARACIERTSACTAEARALLSGVGNDAVVPDPSQLQTIEVTPEVYRQLMAQQTGGNGMLPPANLTPAQGGITPDYSPGPGMYL